jgi:hypothetical protein
VPSKPGRSSVTHGPGGEGAHGVGLRPPRHPPGPFASVVPDREPSRLHGCTARADRLGHRRPATRSRCSAAAPRTRSKKNPYGVVVDLRIERVPGTRVRDGAAATERKLPTQRVLPGRRSPPGATVSFCGVVRDHSPGRLEARPLEYEVHPDHAVPQAAEDLGLGKGSPVTVLATSTDAR